MNSITTNVGTGTVEDTQLTLTESDLVQLDYCPVCRSTDFMRFCRTEFRGTSVYHQRCLDCSHVFLNPRPNQNWYDRLFAEMYWEGRARKWGVDVNKNITQWRKQLLRAEQYLSFLEVAELSLPANARILEIGCAYGLIVHSLAERCHGTALGAEPSRVAREFAQQEMGVEFVAEAFSDLANWQPSAREQVDIILFSHVMEYIADLDDVFTTIQRVVKPGGLILMETPDVYFRAATHIYHPNCFSRRSLERIFGRFEMDIVEIVPQSKFKTLLSPDHYLTLAARLTTDSDARKEYRPPRSAWYTGALMKVGRTWHQIGNIYPLSSVLAKLYGGVRHLSPEGEHRLEKLLVRLNVV